MLTSPSARAPISVPFTTNVPIVLMHADRMLLVFPTAEQLRDHFALTTTEARVALLLAMRRSNDQIASVLSISTHTARHHTEKVFLKLRVHRRMDVADRIAPLFADQPTVGVAQA